MLHTANVLATHERESCSVKNIQLCNDIVEAHCYFVDIGGTDREQIRSRINNNDCRTFRPRRPLSTATELCNVAMFIHLATDCI